MHVTFNQCWLQETPEMWTGWGSSVGEVIGSISFCSTQKKKTFCGSLAESTSPVQWQLPLTVLEMASVIQPESFEKKDTFYILPPLKFYTAYIQGLVEAYWKLSLMWC